MARAIKAFIVVFLIIGFFGFSISAHRVIEEESNVELRQTVKDLELKNASLKEKIGANRLESTYDRNKIYDTLIIMYPGEENIKRLDALFYPKEPEITEETSETDNEEVVEEEVGD